MKSINARYFIHRINPLSVFKDVSYAAHSSALSTAIHRCRVLAEESKGKNWIGFYRVVDSESTNSQTDVVFLSHVNFDTVTHYDMREAMKQV